MTLIMLAMLELFPVRACAEPGSPHYFITIHNGASAFENSPERLEDSRRALLEMIRLADAGHLRLTLLFSAQYAFYIASDPARLAELEGWKKSGHEIGAYHEGPDAEDWDGYSDLPPEALARARKGKKTVVKAFGHREYFAALARLEAEMKTGCMTGSADREFSAAGPAYETCPGPERGAAGAAKKTGAGSDGINYSLGVFGNKKTLSCAHPFDRAGSAASKKAFLGMAAGVYGVSFKSAPSEFGAYYAWLKFLKSEDPRGLRNRTVSGIVEGKLLPEKKFKPAAEPLEAEKREVAARPVSAEQKFPRLRRVPGLSGLGESGLSGPPRRLCLGYCGDGVCDVFERAFHGRCPRDCGK